MLVGVRSGLVRWEVGRGQVLEVKRRTSGGGAGCEAEGVLPLWGIGRWVWSWVSGVAKGATGWEGVEEVLHDFDYGGDAG